MTAPGDPAPDILSDALLAVALLRIDPKLGGIVLRGDGPAREMVLDAIGPVRKVPRNVDVDRLVGGLDLGATLARGRPVAQRGLLAEADGGVLLLPGAERLDDAVVSVLCAVLDRGEVVAERDGVGVRNEARVAVVALDDGVEDEAVAISLAERLAFRFNLSTISVTPDLIRGPWADVASREALVAEGWPWMPDQVRHDEIEGQHLAALASVATAFGVDSMRALLFATRTARALATLGDRTCVTDADIATAARLVLGPRATRMPSTETPEEPEPAPEPPPPSDTPGDDQQGDLRQLDDVVLEAVLASLPPDMLAAIADGTASRAAATRARGKGEKRKSPTRGRPVGVRSGIPRGGVRLSLIDTLRAAAPWQRLRGRDDARIRVRKDDLRIRRFESRAEATTIFAVDASGSSALARLAEAKGAVELMLAQAYVKRAQVALVAFRGEGAELLLPPTRSLARARRALAELPGGGGTPIAAGLTAAHELAEAAKARGRTPFMVVLTDGRANVALSGGPRSAAQSDAETAARAIGLAGIAGAFVDISARPRPEGVRLAAAMGARYLPLPRADAVAMHAAVSAVQPK